MSNRQGTELQYGKKPTRVRFGEGPDTSDVINTSAAPGDSLTEALNNTLLTKYVVGPVDGEDQYNELSEAVAAAGAVATGGQWALVLVKPGIYNSGFELPPNVKILGLGGGDRLTALNYGKITISTPGSRAIEGMDLRAVVGGGASLFSMVHGGGAGNSDLYLRRCYLNSNVAGVPTIDMVGLSGTQKARLYLYDVEGALPSADPAIEQGAETLIEVRGYTRLNVATTKVWSMIGNTNCDAILYGAQLQGTLLLSGDVADMQAHNGVSIRALLLDPAVDIANATARLRCYGMVEVAGGVGADDVDGIGVLDYAALTGRETGLPARIAGGLTVATYGANTVYDPTTVGDWDGPPADTSAALDELAARVTVLEP